MRVITSSELRKCMRTIFRACSSRMPVIIKIVSKIEECIFDYEPDVLITHHPADIHIDHGITAECCLEAASRLPQRQLLSVAPIKRLCLWKCRRQLTGISAPPMGTLYRMYLFRLTCRMCMPKIKAISVYKDVIRKVPHPRSEEALYASIMRGSQCGAERAEAFQLCF